MERKFLALSLWCALGCLGSSAACVLAQEAADNAPGNTSGNAPGNEPAKADAARLPRSGHWIRISLPIDSATATRVQRQVRRTLDNDHGATRPVFIFEFEVPASGGEYGKGTRFGDALTLADFLSSKVLNGATTVAYVPQAIKGHAVLVALACDQIIMAEKASLGEAGADEEDDAISPTVLSAYRDIPSRRRTVPAEVALGLLQKSREVLIVRTEVSTEFVTPAGLEELKKQHPIQSQEVWKAAGSPGQFTGAEGRKLGLVSVLAEERRDVVRALELSPEAVTGNLAPDGAWRAIRIELKGPINEKKIQQAERLIKDEISTHGINFVCLWLDSPGGSPVDSMQLANYLADLDPGAVRTVAYIPSEARADAAVIAMACDQVLMHPQAILGGPGAYQMTPEQIASNRQVLRQWLAPRKMRTWSPWVAMIDPDLEVFRCTRLGDVDYFSDEELTHEQPQPQQGEKGKPWVKGLPITTPGRAWSVDGTRAVEYHLAQRLVDNFAQLKQFYGLEHDPAMIEPGWADFLIDAMASPGVAALLLILGGAGLYVELHSPGTGIGGFVAALCFLLFFWSHFLGGTAGWLEVTLFLAGIVCLLMEVFVLPGSGILGLGGGGLVLASLVLASQTFVWPHNDYQLAQLERSLGTIAGAGLGLVVVALVLRRWLPGVPLLQHVFLTPPQGDEAETISRREMLVDLRNLVGVRGITATQLTPGGKARFGNELVDVMADGELIPRNSPVIVVAVHGNRVVVRAENG